MAARGFSVTNYNLDAILSWQLVSVNHVCVHELSLVATESDDVVALLVSKGWLNTDDDVNSWKRLRRFIKKLRVSNLGDWPDFTSFCAVLSEVMMHFVSSSSLEQLVFPNLWLSSPTTARGIRVISNNFGAKLTMLVIYLQLTSYVHRNDLNDWQSSLLLKRLAFLQN
jgi:hypothetical protein